MSYTYFLQYVLRATREWKVYNYIGTAPKLEQYVSSDRSSAP